MESVRQAGWEQLEVDVAAEEHTLAADVADVADTPSVAEDYTLAVVEAASSDFAYIAVGKASLELGEVEAARFGTGICCTERCASSEGSSIVSL